jgi:hypothetical protein
MKLKLALILVFLLLPIMSYAGEKEDLATELMRLTEVEKMLDQMKSQIMQMQNQMMDQKKLAKNIRKKLWSFRKNS